MKVHDRSGHVRGGHVQGLSLDMGESDVAEVQQKRDNLSTGAPAVCRREIRRAAGPARPQAAIARRSSTVAPSSVSRRSNRPAHSDEASSVASTPRRVGEALQRPHEDGELEIRGGDPVRAGRDAGAREHRLPLDELGGARPAVPRAALRLVGLQLEQVARERPVEPGERGLDAVRGPPQRRLAPPAVEGSASPRPQRSSSLQNASAATSQARSCATSRRAVSSFGACSTSTCGHSLKPRSPRGESSAGGASGRR